MKNAKRVIIPVVIVLVVLLALNSCKDTLGAAIDQATGKADTVQEEDTTQWAELTSDPLSLEGIGDPSAKYAAAAVNSCLNIVFNGIWSRQTDYFTAPNGVITLTGYGTAEGTQKYKIALWRKVDGGAQYVDGSTYYIKTDGQNYRCSIGGLLYLGLRVRGTELRLRHGSLFVPGRAQLAGCAGADPHHVCV